MANLAQTEQPEYITPPHQSESRDGTLPVHNQTQQTNGKLRIAAAGESGRSGIHPLRFLAVCFRSSCTLSKWTNVLWPVVPAAIVVGFVLEDHHLLVFSLAYVAMVPAANLIGFAGQEMARKLPRVLGVILETTLGSLVEIVLLMILISQGDAYVRVIKAAVLGSILANVLLCLGLCFIAGGVHHKEQEFAPVVSEVGSGLLLVATVGLVVPAAFGAALRPSNEEEYNSKDNAILQISRATAIILLSAYIIYVIFQMKSHHGLYDSVLEADEEKDRDRHIDEAKHKLTATECAIALSVAIGCVSVIAYLLVREIDAVVSTGVSDSFLGLILIPLIEKASEHLTATDEAYDGASTGALAHVLGSSIQTALLNTPLVVIVGWGLGRSMDLNFYTFDSITLILAILVVGNFLRDGKSNYLEGALCVLVYIIIAVCAWYYPDWAIVDIETNPFAPTATAEGGGTATAAARLALRTLVG